MARGSGRGPVTRLPSLLTRKSTSRAAIRSGVGIADAYKNVANSERGHWLLFDEYHPRNVTASYKELEWE